MTPPTAPSTPPPARTGRKVLIYVAVGLGLLFVCGFGGIFAAAFIPSFVSTQYRAKRSEVPTVVDQLRTAQLEYHGRTGRYLACGSEASAQTALADGNGTSRRPFPSGDGECWAELGWAPNHAVRGEYWMVVAEDGSDFQVHGICDADGDGEFAVVVADRTNPAMLVTDTTIY